MKTIKRDNTHKKNITNKIFNTVGVPLSLAAKLVDDIISILILNVILKKHFKIKNFGSFKLIKKKKKIRKKS